MKIGELRKRIEILEVVETRDGYGGITPSWITAYRAWAKVEDLTGRELYQAEQTSEQATARFTIRYRKEFKNDGLTSKMTILYQGKTYDIKSISDLEQAHREVEMMATQRPLNRAR